MPDTLTMLQKCKNALGVTDSEYDDELQDLIDAAKADLGIAGITQNEVETDPLIKRAIKTFVVMNFGAPENYQQLLESYETQKKQLKTATGYTDWDDGTAEDSDDGQSEEEPDPAEDGEDSGT